MTEESYLDSRHGQGTLFSKTSRPVLRHTDTPFQRLLGISSARLKWLRCGADHLPQTGAEGKNE